MTTITLTCTGASVQADVCGELTSGMAGIEVNIDFDAAWEGLTPTFYAGNTTDKAIPMAIDAGGLTKIPPEVMISGKELLIGARGVNAAGDVVLPTRWACCGMIDPSPDDAETVTPKPPVTPGIVDQIKAQAYAAAVNAAESKEAAEGAQLSAGASAASAAESAEAANRAADEASGAKQAANEAGQKAATAEGKADTALSIASGASRAFTAETFQALQAWLRDPANAGKLMRGDNLYIVALDTPDYWVVSTLPSADPETGYYYRISPLETSKVDLSGYAKLSQLSTVATSGDYNDLKNKPTIPADQSQKIEELEEASTELNEGLTQLETAVNGKYSKPADGIPETDLSAEVQQKLNSGGGGGGEDNWELLHESTTEEETSQISLSTIFSDAGYTVKKIFVHVYVTANSAGASRTMQVKLRDTNAGTKIFSNVTINGAQNHHFIGRAEAESEFFGLSMVHQNATIQPSQKLYAHQHSAGTATVSYGGPMNNRAKFTGVVVTFTGSTLCGVGTRVEIWGVKA